LYQVRKPENRHLVDVRSVESLPPHEVVEDVLVTPPADLVCQKVVSLVSRSGTAKRLTDLADISRLLLTFPELKTIEGPVADRLRAAGATGPVLDAWRDIASQEILAEDDEAGF
jgi:hypothetical protein